MKKIKILSIVNAVFGYDGISSVVKNYYLYQNKDNIAMDIMTINEIPMSFKEVIERDGNNHYVLATRNKNPIEYVYELKKVIEKNKYDIVHVHGNSATMVLELMAAKIAGCKIRIAHSHNTKCNHPIINRLLMPLFSVLYTHCCACSVEAGKFLFGNNECYIVNNGLYFPKYTFTEVIREQVRAECKIEKSMVLGHIGRFSYQKNQEFLIKLLKEIVSQGIDVKLLLVGEGETFKEVRGLAEEYKLLEHIVFYGTTDKVNEVLQAMDCFVFPSRFEGLGIVAIEAQAAGLTCVVSDQVPQIVDINKKTKFLSLKDPISNWVTAVVEVKGCPHERKESINMTKKQLADAGFDIIKNCEEIYEYYKKILK